MQFLFRHEKPRKVQLELMYDLYSAIVDRKHFVGHAPTGIGKTDAVLSVALTYALDEGKTIIFLSPKISQHVMALKVVSGISKKHGVRAPTVEFVGKQYMCVHPIARRLKGEEFYELCKRMREKEVCPYYTNYLSDERGSYWFVLTSSVVSHEEVMEKGEGLQECPYEIASELLSEATVIVGDYYHIFSPSIGKVFLKKIQRKLEDLIVIVDEAHNLPERIRKVLSYSLSTRVLEKAAKEAAGLDPETSKALSDMVDALLSNLSSLKPGEQRRINREDLYVWFDFIEFSSFADALEDLGREYLELTGKGKSALLKTARFLKGWDEGDGPFLHYVHAWKDGVTYAVARKALDPAYASKDVFSSIHSGVLISGTLTPGEMYRDLLGMEPERTVIREYPSPFPSENRLNVIVPTVTTRFSKRKPSEYEKIAKEIMRIVSAIPGNVAVFFPSYDVLSSVLPYLDFGSRPYFVQKPDMAPDDVRSLLTAFRANKHLGAVLLAVAGGSFAEGVDYPGSDLLGAIVVGIPLAEMNLEIRALIDYYDEKFGRGWFYGYIYPAISKALQAAGRVIRSESDRGVVVFLDERYTWKNYKKAFPRDFSAVVTSDPVPYIKRFWRQS